MADATLNKFLPLEISYKIQFLLHKIRMKYVLKELLNSIQEILSYNKIKDSGGFSYLLSANTTNSILFNSSSIAFLTRLTWYEFWEFFSKLKQIPKRNLSPLVSHRLNNKNISSNKPFKCCHKKWFT
tara:strand:+ start:358 stop:738 length:381 start_codon:yes stop_codon:yes gene_type:complete